MTNEQKFNNLSVPSHPIDVILDTDAYNEIDDQFAIAYLLKNSDKLNVKAIYAAPFHNEKSSDPCDGMIKSYEEIFKVLELMGKKVSVINGSPRFLPNENKAVISDAASHLARTAMEYTPDNPLYVVAIGAITNIASAILQKPEITENIVVVWLGSNALHYHDTKEFNLMQDIAAARVVISSGVPFVILPCMGVVSAFTLSHAEIKEWLLGKNPLATYLGENTITAAEAYAKGKPWTRVIWDVTAVAWLLNDGERFMRSQIVELPLPGYDHKYEKGEKTYPVRYVYHIWRDSLMRDLIEKLCK
ncbi:MAG: nucleoside hydrolase [Ruminococcaceae bacterium]|nr:nucleoside hydrolase [Oscillospiraceae bacterium]